MAYTKPMTAEQRQEASERYRSFRRHLRQLRQNFPATSAEQKRAFTQYQEAIKSFGLEISKPLIWIDPATLTELEYSACIAMYSYIALRSRGKDQ